MAIEWICLTLKLLKVKDVRLKIFDQVHTGGRTVLGGGKPWV